MIESFCRERDFIQYLKLSKNINLYFISFRIYFQVKHSIPRGRKCIQQMSTAEGWKFGCMNEYQHEWTVRSPYHARKYPTMVILIVMVGVLNIANYIHMALYVHISTHLAHSYMKNTGHPISLLCILGLYISNLLGLYTYMYVDNGTRNDTYHWQTYRTVVKRNHNESLTLNYYKCLAHMKGGGRVANVGSVTDGCLSYCKLSVTITL